MAKRIKPKNLLDDSEISIKPSEPEHLKNDNTDVEHDNEQSIISSKHTQLVDQSEVLQKTIVELTEKNSQLEAKLAEYIETASENSTKIEEYDHLKSENARLLKENKELRDEADSYLVKISELTFENATKTCQLQELQKVVNPPINAINSQRYGNSTLPSGKTTISPNQLNLPSNSMFNGYTSWN